MSKDILLSMFNVTDWKDETTAYIECPGKGLHTGKNGKKDCRVNLDGAPTVFCLHNSCSSVIEDMNYKFRKALWDNKPGAKREFTSEEKEKIKQDLKKKREDENVRKWASEKREIILKKYEWTFADAFHESPFTTDYPGFDSNVFLNKMFNREDVIWIGQPTDSGSPSHKKNFRTVKEWLIDDKKESFTSASIFKPDSFSRSNASVLTRPYLVIESDTLSLDQSCSLFKWLKGFMKLVAIVYTGGKSAHGWFKFPSETLLEKLKICLPEMGCDEALFKPSQPVRLPGVMRGDKWQSIFYFNF